jgi:hypothetical protein
MSHSGSSTVNSGQHQEKQIRGSFTGSLSRFATVALVVSSFTVPLLLEASPAMARDGAAGVGATGATGGSTGSSGASGTGGAN